MNSEDPVIVLKGVFKDYPGTPEPVKVLHDISLSVNSGERLAIVGPSGCGKSTLLNLMGTLDEPSSGQILFKGQDVSKQSPAGLAALRNREIGFVFQLHHLLPQCTVLENVLVPALLVRETDGFQQRAAYLLECVGLKDRLDHRPGQLSGGERQRVAVARALINRPSLLLADEPTGSLNQESAEELVDMLLHLNREEGMALVVVTHSQSVAGRMERMLEIRGGTLVPRE
ncbi:MAG TPA: ABC transporter ATP-binding protein [Candidatus Hydrogenedentes bacterium]|nr:ABC transporter ATP-binding protein [Candidatus Hydrogenedentota bacterium]